MKQKMIKTIPDIIKEAIRQGKQEASDEFLGNANIHYADLDGMVSSAQALLSQGNNESHKGLVKRLLSQLEIDIELDKAVALCNDFHSELSQGEPVAWLVEGINAYIDYSRAVGTAQANMRNIMPLYTVQPSTEALQKDKAELIEFYKKLLLILK